MVDTKTKLIIYDSKTEPYKQIKFINSYLKQQEKNIICMWRDLTSLNPKEILSYLISIESIGMFFATPKPLEPIQSIVVSEGRLIKDKLTEHMKFYDSLFLENDKIVVCNSYAASFKKFIEDNVKDQKIYYDIGISELNKMFELIALFNENVVEWKQGVVLRDAEVLFRTSNSKAIAKNEIIIDDLDDLGKLGYYIISMQITNYFKETNISELLKSETYNDLRNVFWENPATV